MELAELFTSIVTLLTDIVEIVRTTVGLLNGVDFNNSIVAEYLGYVRFIFGPTLWLMFSTVLLIPLGVTVWIYCLKGIGYIKEILPW